MKIPKLKRFYMALNSQDYEKFCQSRQFEISSQVTIDIATGAVSGLTRLLLNSSAAGAELNLRKTTSYQGSVYVLYIDRQWLDRAHLTRLTADPEIYEYRQTLRLPHCGVERFDLA